MLHLTFTAEKVISNRTAIDTRIAELQAEIAACNGLHAANQSVCPHKRKRDVYDPGYAGGGHDGYKCEDCGKRGHF
jgi:transposase-like protein